MTTVRDVPPTDLIEAVAAELAGNSALKPPEWASYVKTGAHKEKVPDRSDWWHVRCAAILRKVYLRGPIGAARLAQLFGGPKDRGSLPTRAATGSENIARTALQQLQEAGLVTGDKKGRSITPAGQKLLDNTAHAVRAKVQEVVPGLAKY